MSPRNTGCPQNTPHINQFSTVRLHHNYVVYMYDFTARKLCNFTLVQYTNLTPDKILNSLVYRTLFYVNIYGSFKLSKNSPVFLAHPVVAAVSCGTLDNRRSPACMVFCRLLCLTPCDCCCLQVIVQWTRLLWNVDRHVFLGRTLCLWLLMGIQFSAQHRSSSVEALRPTRHIIGPFGDDFYRPDYQTNSVKALKETSWSLRSGLNSIRTTPPCYNNTTLDNSVRVPMWQTQSVRPVITAHISVLLTVNIVSHNPAQSSSDNIPS